MYIKRKYSLWMTFNWSKRPFILGFIYSLAISVISYFTNLYIAIPWQPISIIGISVAFYLGFKNNSSYDRTWEARKIWGSIVNNSRAFGAAVTTFVQGEDAEKIHKELIYRHIAWFNSLRHQLRLSRPWEHDTRLNEKYAPNVCEDYMVQLEDDLIPFLSTIEMKYIEQKSNGAAQILQIQSKRLQELKDQGYFEDFRHMELNSLIINLYADQGKTERIKNFPFPRQYASTAIWLTFVFCAFVPFGLLAVFKDLNSWMYWLGPFISALIIWIFFLMEKIGDYSENPFEGTYNDVPITSIAKAIEIDLREMLNDDNIPSPTPSENGFLM
ncbi:MAG: putative membrane protein [Bacteroidia bacterium]|jgi:putative membrane protein